MKAGRLLLPWALVAILVLGLASAGSDASRPARAAAGARIALRLIGQFDQPLYVAQAPGDSQSVMVVQQTGKIIIARNGKSLPQPFLDLTSKIKSGGEQGLLSMAFAPDYQSSGHFYVDYTDSSGNSQVVEYTRGANAGVADPGSARVVLSQTQPEENHNGGLLQFGPDGYLYIGFGDGGGGGDQHGTIGNGQDLGTWLGKILRIDPAPSGGKPYTVPGDNPFVSRGGALPEIYSYGLRNPWRFSFDRATGALAIGDVGQNLFEEVNYEPKGGAAGANFGWRVFEGNSRYTPGQQPNGPVTAPGLVYAHANNNCSVTGGYVVRDRSLRGLYGRYIYADFCAGKIRSVKLAPGKATGDRAVTGGAVASPSSFGEDNAGHLYVASIAGKVYRIVSR